MELTAIIIFIVGYLLIALEHPIGINKTATALVTGVLCWTLFAFDTPIDLIKPELSHHLSDIASILFFLMGAMTIVELIDAHQGFRFITNIIKTSDVRKLLWIVCWVAFFLSAVLDNLTTAIVMVSLTRKLVADRNQRLFFAGMIIVAANAGGAWSPIGDVTTTMLWIGGQVSTVEIIRQTFTPSVICLLTPLIYLSFKLKGKLEVPPGTSCRTEIGGWFEPDVDHRSWCSCVRPCVQDRYALAALHGHVAGIGGDVGDFGVYKPRGRHGGTKASVSCACPFENRHVEYSVLYGYTTGRWSFAVDGNAGAFCHRAEQLYRRQPHNHFADRRGIGNRR
jgi:hypothetical protein